MTRTEKAALAGLAMVGAIAVAGFFAITAGL